MALFAQYTAPGVYTFETVSNPGVITYGNIRLPVFIGEGQETFSVINTEMHRGSSAYADDLVVQETLPVLTVGQLNFQLTYTPIVTGNGTGTLTNTPTDITVTLSDGQTPVVVTGLNGTTGAFSIFTVYPVGTELLVTYYFKRKDTYVANENEASQVPSYATWASDPNLPLTLSLPGELGNDVDLGFTFTAASPVSDALAISGVGTDTISIELNEAALPISTTGSLTFAAHTVTRASGSWATDGVAVGTAVRFAGTTANNTASGSYQIVTGISTGSNPNDTLTFSAASFTVEVDASATVTAYAVRTYGDLANLLTVGIPTLAGNLALQAPLSSGIAAQTVTAAVASAPFTGGAGPNSNTVFTTSFIPVVDGTNGGVVTTNPLNLKVLVNGQPATVSSLNGMTGTFVMASPVLAGQTFTVSYYTNKYQDTYDMIPATNVVSIDAVGYGPSRSDFVNGVDFVLQTPPNADARIQWGGSASVMAGSSTPGYTAFNASVITDTLVDEIMFLRPVQGAVTGKNYTFILPDVPTDGSGLGVVTNNPALVHVYVGTNPEEALLAGEVTVTQVVGATSTVVLYNPPPMGQNVYATYYRNILNDHTFTLTVVNPGITGQGTYSISDEKGNTLPVIASGASSVVEAAFTEYGGVVWPNKFSDLNGVGGKSPDETVTVTFQEGDASFVISPGVQASLVSTVNVGLKFVATNIGTGPNSVATIQFVGTTAKADAAAISVTSNAVTVYTEKIDTTTRTLQDILNLFIAYPPSTPTTGVILAEAVGSPTLTNSAAAGVAEDFINGAATVSTPRSLHYCVTSSRTALQANTDGFGITGGATTPLGSNVGGGAVGAIGWLNQTFLDPDTGVQFTILNPDDVLADPLYGFQSLPSPRYHFEPGDTLTFTISKETPRATGVIPTVNVYGLTLEVISTYGMNAGNTAMVTTFNASGNQPSVGDYYYISYTTEKKTSDFALKIFDNVGNAYAQYGQPTPDNRLSMAVSLFAQNGGNIFACLQVPKQAGLNTAADQTYINAISTLAAPVPGNEQKAGMIQVLTTSPTVIQYLSRFLLTQASPRNSGEAMSVYGYGFNDTPSSMISLATSLKSERMIGIASIGAILQLVNPTTGLATNYTVDGSLIAAAMAGMMVSPAIDVATTLTRQGIVGFQGLITRYDDPSMDNMAASGLTCLVENPGALIIRHWVTTDNSSPLKREPTSRLVIDYVRQTMRSSLNQFIGRKLINSTINTVTSVVSSTLVSLVAEQVIEGYSTIVVAVDPSDPTTLNVSFTVKPIFSLLWISVTLTVTTQL